VANQGAMISGRGKDLLHRQSDRRETDLHGNDVVTGVIGQMPATTSASTITPFIRQFHRKETGSHRAGYDTKMVTGQGWMLPIVGPVYEGGSTLRRQMHNRDTELRRLYSRGETPLHPFDNPTKEVAGHLSATRHVSSIGEVEMRTPAGMISLPALALNIVQRRVVIPGRHSSKSDPLSYIEEPWISLPGVGGERSRPSEANSETGIVHRRLLLSQASANLNGFDKGHSLFRRTVGNPAAPLAVATWGETRADVADHRLSKSSALRVIQPREAVHPVLVQRVAARKDLWRGRGEEASTVVMRDAVHDMPLLQLPGTESRNRSISSHGINGAVVQTSPQSSAPVTAGASTAERQRGDEEAGGVETGTHAAQAQIDLDELMDKVWQKLMRNLTIEQERRGWTRWVSKS
jgi:hypothetical protein